MSTRRACSNVGAEKNDVLKLKESDAARLVPSEMTDAMERKFSTVAGSMRPVEMQKVFRTSTRMRYMDAETIDE